VLFLTGHGDIAMSVQAMKLGAVDFLTKPVERDVLLRAIETALERYAEDRARRTHLEELQSRYRKLTPRERDVFSRIVEGQLNKTVASEWGMSLRTVKAHRAHVMEKLGASSIVDLVRFAAELGLGRE
jgi:FixJ family two-component response regulator